MVLNRVKLYYTIEAQLLLCYLTLMSVVEMIVQALQQNHFDSTTWCQVAPPSATWRQSKKLPPLPPGGARWRHLAPGGAVEVVLQQKKSVMKDSLRISECEGMMSGALNILEESFNSKLSDLLEGTDGGGWIVIQRRINGSTDFYRGWEEYKAGFGNLMGEFWLASGNRELRVELEDEDGQKAFAHYSHFQVLSEEKGYQLNVSGYTGTAGDSLSYHDGMKFSTFDKDNDLRKGNCAIDYEGAWWYKSCVNSNLNGI
ncbi:TENR-like protein [Mya arenaria]|uniref:TENR-like protein n=1 Tax=Mya arenaria TaxID=6604 RepID=A0ABY7EKN0_MYAAR|nr:TENR-like protein [Mya arenaria]